MLEGFGGSGAGDGDHGVADKHCGYFGHKTVGHRKHSKSGGEFIDFGMR